MLFPLDPTVARGKVFPSFALVIAVKERLNRRMHPLLLTLCLLGLLACCTQAQSPQPTSLLPDPASPALINRDPETGGFLLRTFGAPLFMSLDGRLVLIQGTLQEALTTNSIQSAFYMYDSAEDRIIENIPTPPGMNYVDSIDGMSDDGRYLHLTSDSNNFRFYHRFDRATREFLDRGTGPNIVQSSHGNVNVMSGDGSETVYWDTVLDVPSGRAAFVFNWETGGRSYFRDLDGTNCIADAFGGLDRTLRYALGSRLYGLNTPDEGQRITLYDRMQPTNSIVLADARRCDTLQVPKSVAMDRFGRFAVYFHYESMFNAPPPPTVDLCSAGYLYLYDLATRTTRVVGLGTGGALPDGRVGNDGPTALFFIRTLDDRYDIFTGNLRNADAESFNPGYPTSWSQLFIHDRQTLRTTCVTQKRGGGPAIGPQESDIFVGDVSLCASTNGHVIAVASKKLDLIPPGETGVEDYDAFLYRMVERELGPPEPYGTTGGSGSGSGGGTTGDMAPGRLEIKQPKASKGVKAGKKVRVVGKAVSASRLDAARYRSGVMGGVTSDWKELRVSASGKKFRARKTVLAEAGSSGKTGFVEVTGTDREARVFAPVTVRYEIR